VILVALVALVLLVVLVRALLVLVGPWLFVAVVVLVAAFAYLLARRAIGIHQSRGPR